jgi:hypothetical protein
MECAMAQQAETKDSRKNLESIRSVLTHLEHMAGLQNNPDTQASPPPGPLAPDIALSVFDRAATASTQQAPPLDLPFRQRPALNVRPDRDPHMPAPRDSSPNTHLPAGGTEVPAVLRPHPVPGSVDFPQLSIGQAAIDFRQSATQAHPVAPNTITLDNDASANRKTANISSSPKRSMLQYLLSVTAVLSGLVFSVVGWRGDLIQKIWIAANSQGNDTETRPEAIPTSHPAEAMQPKSDAAAGDAASKSKPEATPVVSQANAQEARAHVRADQWRLLLGDVEIQGAQASIFPIYIEDNGKDSAAAQPYLLIHGLPGGALLDKGVNFRIGSWKLMSNQLSNLKLSMPPNAPRITQLTVEMVSEAGEILARERSLVIVQSATATSNAAPGAPAHSTGEVAPQVQTQTQFQTSLPAATANADDDHITNEARARTYMARGQELLATGNVTSARAFFKRAAEAHAPQGALAMGATYDANYFEVLGIKGMQPDSDVARRWYERAAELGSKDALDRIAELK